MSFKKNLIYDDELKFCDLLPLIFNFLSASSVDSDDSYRPPPKKRGRRPRAVKADHRSKTQGDIDLKPLTMVKKSRKQFVPDEKKDDKYWARRRKNNMAAKRSRDARRAKENQIVVKAGHLEKQVRENY